MESPSGHSPNRLAAASPAVYVVWDILQLDGRWLMDRPWSGRRQILEETLEPGLCVAINPVVHEDGRGLFQRAVAADFEGVVGKKKTSKYQPGERSADWRKIKNWQVTEAWVV
ncbi:MAG: hypothetical protein M1598_08930 [Actinobacteria bacterium]|nr:hypothetical protein [Actinomycetota bacterium]